MSFWNLQFSFDLQNVVNFCIIKINGFLKINVNFSFIFMGRHLIKIISMIIFAHFHRKKLNISCFTKMFTINDNLVSIFNRLLSKDFFRVSYYLWSNLLRNWDYSQAIFDWLSSVYSLISTSSSFETVLNLSIKTLNYSVPINKFFFPMLLNGQKQNLIILNVEKKHDEFDRLFSIHNE